MQKNNFVFIIKKPPVKKHKTEEPETWETWGEDDNNWSQTGRCVRFVTDSQMLLGILT